MQCAKTRYQAISEKKKKKTPACKKRRKMWIFGSRYEGRITMVRYQSQSLERREGRGGVAEKKG